NFNENKSSLFTWFLQLSRRIVKDKFPNAHIKNNPLQPVAEINKAAAEAETAEEITPEIIGHKEVMKTLRTEQKELADLIIFMGYTQAEAAQKLKMPMGTVKTRVRSAILELRNLFQQV